MSLNASTYWARLPCGTRPRWGLHDAPPLRLSTPAAHEATTAAGCASILDSGVAPIVVAWTQWVLGDVLTWVVWLLWSQGKLYWLDINGKKLWSYSPTSKESKSWELPEVAGSFAFREGGGFLMGFASGLTFYDPATGASEKVNIAPCRKASRIPRRSGLRAATVNHLGHPSLKG